MKPMWFGISIIMIPLTLILTQQGVNRWLNIIVAALAFVFNLFGLPGYPSAYDRYLIVLTLVFNVVTIIIAWNWV